VKLSLLTRRQTIDYTPSTTAGVVVFLRACAYKEKASFQGPDHLAAIFYRGLTKSLLDFSPITLPVLRALLPGLYEYITARTNFLDQVFLQALAHSIPQIVLLGAGYDTRTYRFAHHNHGTQVFEVDAPATQRAKRAGLARAEVTIPSRTHFVPLDLNQDDLGDALGTAGFSTGQATLFIWEGVTMYLTAAAVDATLAFISHNTPVGSSVAFDYAYRSAVTGKGDYYGAKQVIRYTRLLGEPYRFGIGEATSDEIAVFLAKRGFKTLAHYKPQVLQRAYLPQGEGGPYGRIAGYCGNVHAEIRGTSQPADD
jgi:methyltransferase (TIGR00027 family)